MATEIERKFLVVGDGWRRHVTRTERLQQGYLATGRAATVRVRTVGDDTAYLTVKSGGSTIARGEFEYQIPVSDALQILTYCGDARMGKTRHHLDLKGGDWVVDEFEGKLQGLVMAEVELESTTHQIELPGWVGDEVTGDPQYYNSSLAMLPPGGEI